MLGWFKKVWILIYLTNWTTNLLSIFYLLICFRAHMNPEALCLWLWFKIPGHKDLSKFSSPEFPAYFKVCDLHWCVFLRRRCLYFRWRARLAKRNSSWNWLFLLFLLFRLVQKHHWKEVIVWLHSVFVSFLELFFVWLAVIEHLSFKFLVGVDWDSFLCLHRGGRTELILVAAGLGFFSLVSKLVQAEHEGFFIIFVNLLGRAKTDANRWRIRLVTR